MNEYQKEMVRAFGASGWPPEYIAAWLRMTPHPLPAGDILAHMRAENLAARAANRKSVPYPQVDGTGSDAYRGGLGNESLKWVVWKYYRLNLDKTTSCYRLWRDMTQYGFTLLSWHTFDKWWSSFPLRPGVDDVNP